MSWKALLQISGRQQDPNGLFPDFAQQLDFVGVFSLPGFGVGGLDAQSRVTPSPHHNGFM